MGDRGEAAEGGRGEGTDEEEDGYKDLHMAHAFLQAVRLMKISSV